MIRRIEECKDDFERDFFRSLQSTADELQRIYEEKETNDDGEIMTFNDYFDDYLDVNFLVNRNKEYKSASICITLGGPNVYIDTDDSYVKGYWGGTVIWIPFSYYVRDEIDAIFEDIYSWC